ncbi:hypothetical protein GMA1_64 [Gordonia phage GMA1]|uniref:replication initiation protein n=1 Tax=Gordonia phage GMA1 TaxID=1647470 RepID=UPI0007B63E15|nr:replication initiation protein [Gordonia phage GMA1]AKJ72161.1 hypothetical protein GMA1_64 [Gordonia phage GMA1]
MSVIEVTWFKVDDGFYDHPKLTGVPMASRGLWVTAGSYCARHLTDGVISWRQIRSLGGTRAQVRGLVDAGLWRAIGERSGDDTYAYHDWIGSQPTRTEVLNSREREREKKAKWREKKDQKQRDQQEPVDVHGGHVGHGDRGQDRPSTVSRPDPTRPDLSIGANAQLSPSARETSRPSDRCPTHEGMDIVPPCGRCGEARRAAEEWDVIERRRKLRDEQRARAAQADVERDAIDRCTLCDARGYAGGRVCEHDPEVSARARRGIDAARRAIGGDA